MTLYSSLRSAIIARWDGQQSIYTVDLGMPSVRGWYHVGEDFQPAQTVTKDETGKGLILVLTATNVHKAVEREGLLQLMPVEQVAARFRSRCEEELGCDDLAYVQDLGALAHGKVVLVVVPRVQLEALIGTDKPAAEPSDNRGIEPSNPDDDDTPEPPTPSATASSAASEPEPAADADGQLSLDFDLMQAPAPSQGEAPSHLNTPAPSYLNTLPRLAERYLRYFGSQTSARRSVWDGKVKTTVSMSYAECVLMAGVLICCALSGILLYMAPDRYQLALVPFLLLPLFVVKAISVWRYRRTAASQLRSAMVSLKNEGFHTDCALRDFINAYDGDQRVSLWTIYDQAMA